MLITKNFKQDSMQSSLSVCKKWLCLLLMSAMALPVFADEAAKVNAEVLAHQACVNKVMSTMHTAAVKRTNIAEQCQQTRQAMINSYPAEVQPLIATNTDRRIESVLDALEQIETAVVESATDVNEITEELDALAGN